METFQVEMTVRILRDILVRGINRKLTEIRLLRMINPEYKRTLFEAISGFDTYFRYWDEGLERYLITSSYENEVMMPDARYVTPWSPYSYMSLHYRCRHKIGDQFFKTKAGYKSITHPEPQFKLFTLEDARVLGVFN